MSLFEDLCDKYLAKIGRDRAYYERSAEIAFLFKKRFSLYIEAPKEAVYLGPNSDTAYKHHVNIMGIDNQGNKTENFTGKRFNEDGFMLFMVELIVGDRSQRVFRGYQAHLGVKPLDESLASLFIGPPGDPMHREFTWDTSVSDVRSDGPEQYLCQLVIDTLDSPPFSSRQKLKSIGFV